MVEARTAAVDEPDPDALSAPLGRIMSTRLLTSSPEQMVGDVAADMRARNIGCTVVLDAEGGVAGLFTERDLLMRVVGAGLDPFHTPVSRVMTRDVESLDADTTIGAAADFLNRRGFRHVPVLRDGKLSGIVSIRDLFRIRLRHLEAARDEEARALRELRALLALDEESKTSTLLAINQRLQELALTDELTGLFNHRYFRQRLEQEVARAQRMLAPLSLLFIDIDHFKRVNDTWGHLTGDHVLRHVAAMLRASIEGASVLARLRKSDVVVRYGGEEFAVLVMDARSAGALALAERVRAAVEATPLPLPDGTTLTVTISIGVASFPEHADKGEDLVRAADLALYRAKGTGRNRVECASARSADPQE